jgi:ABC-type multidrug transport system ATPase subunit
LGHVDLDLRLGEITGVVGQNAHGKTTLLRMIAGELQADFGELGYPLFQENSGAIRWPVVKRQIAFVPQELPKWSGLLRDTLHYEASMHGVLGDANHRNVNFIVERLGLGAHVDKSWGQLSGGFKVRFALARALVWKPRLLVLDEPLANLDVKAKGLLLQDLRDLARSYSHPIAVIMSSHDLHNLESVCSQMVFLKSGKVEFIGDVGDLRNRQSSCNEFELGSQMPLSELLERLSGEDVIRSVREEGLNFILTTDVQYSPRSVLHALIQRDVDIQYFRNNSRSIRRLFD